MSTLPAIGLSSPAKVKAKVDLPAPFRTHQSRYFAGIKIQIDTNAKSGPTAKA